MARLFVVWLLLASSVGFAVYQLKYEVRSLERDLTRINRQIVADQEAIHVLKAEWSYLNNPAELEKLATRHLQLEPMKGQQFARIDQLPWKGGKAMPLPVPRPVVPQQAPPGLPDGDFDDDGVTTGAPEFDEPDLAPFLSQAKQPMLLVKQNNGQLTGRKPQ